MSSKKSPSPSKSSPKSSSPKFANPLKTLKLDLKGKTASSKKTNLEYKIGTVLGEGNFGVVHEAKDNFGQPFVIKVLKPNRTKKRVEEDWEKETALLLKLHHPNIIGLYDAFRGKDRLYYMVFEKASGTLYQYIKRNGPMKQHMVEDCAAQLMSGLNHIHSHNIIHRDLHLDNILFTTGNSGNFLVKIGDFGISKLLKKRQKKADTIIGRDYDYAPELIIDESTTKQSDIYQLGLVIYFLHTANPAVSSKDGAPDVIVKNTAQEKAMQLKTPIAKWIIPCLDIKPKNRYKDVLEAMSALRSISGRKKA